MYDAIVVGARCAGSPVAMLLARKGHKVLVVDRATFPSDTMSTHFIQAPGMVRLARWGLVDKLFETGCPPITNGIFYAGEDAIPTELPPHPTIPGLASPRRTILDKLLVDAAREAGAEVREGVTITGLLRDERGRVSGVEGYSSDGPFKAEARYVVGADGRNSQVAEWAGAEDRLRHPEKGVGYYSYFSGMDLPRVELHVTDDVFCVAFPTHDEQVTIAVVWPGVEMKDVRRDVEGHFLATLDTLGDLGERVRAGKREAKYVGLADIDNFLRKAHGPGWALVGDALYFKDPAPADGIADAFRAADLLAEALDDVFSERLAEKEALDRFEALNDELAIPLFHSTVKLTAEGATAQSRFETFMELRMLTEQETEQIESQEVNA